MKYISGLLFCLLTISTQAANPSFESFNQRYFSTNSLNIQGMIGTNAATGSLTNRNQHSSIILELQTNGVTKLEVTGDGDLAIVKSVTYSWPTGHGAANSVLTDTNGSGVLSWQPGASSFTNSVVVWVDPAGDDTTGVRGVREKPFKTLYNVQDKTAHTYYGAITVAQPGDTIIVMPGLYYTPSCPLNMGRNSGGVNLWVMSGATVVRTNKYYSKTGAIQALMTASLSASGPMVIPGNNSKIIVDGTLIDTNTTGAVLGWFDSVNPNLLATYGFTNVIATNVFIGGSGTMLGNVDTLYFAQTNTSRSDITINDSVLLGTYDVLKVSGNSVLTTKNLYGWATNNPASGYAQGVNLDSGVLWYDYGSSFGCSGGTTVNQPLAMSQTTNIFYYTRLWSSSAIILSGASANSYYLSTNATVSGCVTFQDSTGLAVYDSCGLTANTNGINSLITNGINQNARIGPGTVNQISKFVNPTNVSDSIMYQVGSTKIQMTNGVASDASGALELSLLGLYTSSTVFHDLLFKWSVGGGEYEIMTDKGSGGGGTKQLSFGTGGTPEWTITASGHFVPVLSGTYNIGASSDGILNLYTEGTIFSEPNTTLSAMAMRNNQGSSTSAGFYFNGTDMGFGTSVPAESLRISQGHGAPGPFIDCGPSAIAFGATCGTPVAFLRGNPNKDEGILMMGTNNTVAGAPTNCVLTGAYASGANLQGGRASIAGGPGTGTGRSGDVTLRTAESRAAGSTSASLKDREFISAEPVVLTTNAATLVFNFTIPTADTMVGGEVAATTKISDGVDQASVRERFAFQAIRKGSTVTVTSSASVPSASLATGSATIATTWTAVANAQSVDVKCTVITGGINSTNTKTRWRAEFDSDAVPIITAQ